jgi:hypothetical protein
MLLKPESTHRVQETALKIGAAQCVRLYQPSYAFCEELRATRSARFSLYELDSSVTSASMFRAFMLAACRSQGPNSSCVTVHSVEEYTARRLFLGTDGLTGFAVKLGEVASVFRHTGRPGLPTLKNLVALAIQVGGNRLDAYDTNLAARYRACGFTPVARLPWSDMDAPSEWCYEHFAAYSQGRPDVVFMVLGAPAIAPVLVSSYSEGIACQRLALAFADSARPPPRFAERRFGVL